MSMSIWPHPISVLNKAKNDTFARKKRSYRPKTLSLRHNLTLRITWGGSHLATTSSSLCARLKMSKMVLVKDFLT